ncbi:MAG: hypothetical protein ACRDG3_10295 [Tepidiformaceae bacterium]
MSEPSRSRSSSTGGPPPHAASLQTALRDVRWLAGGIWVGILAALLVTSAVSITVLAQGSLLTFSAGSDNAHAVAIAAVLLAVLEAMALFLAWTAFVRATRNLVTAYAYDAGEADEAPAAAEWITDMMYADADPNDPPLAPRMIIADVVQFIGVAWVVLILTPAVMLAVTAFA